MPAPDQTLRPKTPEPALVDAHCHLDLYPDFPAIVRESEVNAVRTLAVTTTPLAFNRNLELTAPTKYVRAALGLHPQVVGERAHEISHFEKLLPLTRYVGEVGLDASPQFYPTFSTQERVFRRILEACAEAGGKILSIHSVRSVRRVLDLIEKNLPSHRGKVILHWFTGTPADAHRAVALGCFFSVNSAMLMRETGKKLVRIMPVDRLLTETDGPFVTLDAHPIRPRDVRRVISTIAETLAEPPEVVQRRVAHNFRELLSFGSALPN